MDAKEDGRGRGDAVRQAGAGSPIGAGEGAAVTDLVKVAGDQGRLGGLFKLWLVDRPGQGAPEIEVRRLLDRLA